jgi:hypothetical protein
LLIFDRVTFFKFGFGPDVLTKIVKSTYTTLVKKVFLGDYG